MTTRIFRGCSILFAFFLTATACGGSGSGETSDPDARPPDQGTGQPGEKAQGRKIANTPGLVVLRCSGKDASDVLEVLDPTNGVVVASTPTGYANGCVAQHPLAGRQRFNDDYTKMAVDFGQQSDGSRHVGFSRIPDKPTDITASQSRSDFSMPPYHSRPVFRPGTNDLWFLTGQNEAKRGLGSVNVDDSSHRITNHPELVRPTFGDPISLYEPEGRFVITRDQWLLPADFIPNPKRPLAVGIQYSRPTVVRQGQSPTESADVDVKSGPEMCAPKAWVDEERLLCISQRNEMIYLGRFDQSYRTLMLQPALPLANRENFSPVMSPTADRFAFLSCSPDSTCGIYTNGVGGGQPAKMTELPRVTDRANLLLLEWRS